MSLFSGHPHSFMGTQAHHRRIRAPTREKFPEMTSLAPTANHANQAPPATHLQFLAVLDAIVIESQRNPSLRENPTQWDTSKLQQQFTIEPQMTNAQLLNVCYHI